MSAGLNAVTAGLVADQSYPRIIDEGMEDADRIGSPADTRGHRIRQAAGPIQDLGASLHPDDTLKVTHHQRKRVRSRSGAEAVIGVVGVGHPIPEGLVHSILEGLRSGLHRDHLGAE